MHNYLIKAYIATVSQVSPTRCTILFNIFISLLYMFRASMCQALGENYCIYATLVFVTLYGWRLVCEIIQGCTVNKTKIITVSMCIMYSYVFRHFRIIIRQFTTIALLLYITFFKTAAVDNTVYKI
jgi:hypothetical protein